MDSRLVIVRELDSTEQVRAISEGRVRPRALLTVPLRESRAEPCAKPVEWLFAVPLPARPCQPARSAWQTLRERLLAASRTDEPGSPFLEAVQ